MTRKKDSVLKFFILLFTISSLILIPVVNVRANSDDHWYAGYYYWEDVVYPWGVKADIYRIDPWIPLYQWVAEYVDIELKNYPHYWIQVGYILEWLIFFRINRFYVETWDKYDHHLDRFGRAQPGHTYTFAIWWDPNYNPPQWYWAVLEGDTWLHSGHKYTDPSRGIDYKVFVESTTPDICIDGSHVTKISYYDPSVPLNWRFWNDYFPWDDPPYVVNDISPIEFWAHGGG